MVSLEREVCVRFVSTSFELAIRLLHHDVIASCMCVVSEGPQRLRKVCSPVKGMVGAASHLLRQLFPELRSQRWK
jgi:hypothetical protein